MSLSRTLWLDLLSQRYEPGQAPAPRPEAGFTKHVVHVGNIYLCDTDATAVGELGSECAYVEDPVNWHAEACLCLRSGVRGKKPAVLFRGQIFEAIHVALQRPEAERSRLFISFDEVDQRLSWAKVAKLAARPDFPVMV